MFHSIWNPELIKIIILNLHIDGSFRRVSSEKPDSDSRPDDEREDVGDDHRVDKSVVLLFPPLLQGDNAAARAGLGRWQFPLLGRLYIGPGAPVPDEVRHEDLPVDVDVSEVQVGLLRQLQAGTVGRRLGWVVAEVGRDSTAGATGCFSLSLS